MFKLRPAPEREPAASVFSIHQTDEEVRDAVIQHYFAPEELVQARHMAEETGSYEEAIRYLVQLGQDSLRDSAEARPPRVYITIPGGRIIIHHPARLGVDNPVLYTFSIAHLACQAFPPPTTRSAPASVPASDPVPLQPLFFDSPQLLSRRRWQALSHERTQTGERKEHGRNAAHLSSSPSVWGTKAGRTPGKDGC